VTLSYPIDDVYRRSASNRKSQKAATAAPTTPTPMSVWSDRRLTPWRATRTIAASPTTIAGTTWLRIVAVNSSAASQRSRPVRRLNASTPRNMRPNATASVNEYSPASVEAMLPPSIVYETLNKNGTVATAMSAGTGRRNPADRPKTYPAVGMSRMPSTVTILKATAYPKIGVPAATMSAGSGK
jgi:hypothetical protein